MHREQGIHLWIWGEILRADGSSGILAQAREMFPLQHRVGEEPPPPHPLSVSAGAFCFKKDVMARP